jgi:hypothetical protein
MRVERGIFVPTGLHKGPVSSSTYAIAIGFSAAFQLETEGTRARMMDGQKPVKVAT